MKFLLLASGQIAISLLEEHWFIDQVYNNAFGIICSPQFFKKIEKHLTNSQKESTFLIDEKQVNETQLHRLLKEKNIDYIISLQYPWILSSMILELANRRVLNLHNSKLPDYRGHNTISHEILNEESFHTTTLHWVAVEVDRGKLVKERAIEIFKDDNAFKLWNRSKESTKILLKEWFQDLDIKNEFPEGNEIIGEGSYYPKEIAQFKVIPQNSDSAVIQKFARAFYFPPHEPAYFQVDDTKIYVLPETWVYR